MTGHTCWAMVHGDCYVIITVYLHKIPVYPSPWKMPVTQGCIPVECVPPTHWPWGVCVPAQGVPSWGDVPARGCTCPGGTSLGGYLPRGGTCPGIRPVDRILDTHFWKYYLAPTLLRVVIMITVDCGSPSMTTARESLNSLYQISSVRKVCE